MHRSPLLLLHRWIGLLFAAMLFVQGLTGAVLVYRDEVMHILHHEALVVEPIGSPQSVQALLDTVRRAHPETKVIRIEYPSSPREAFIFRLERRADGQLAFAAVDPYRGTITRSGDLADWPVYWLFELHHELLAGDAGGNVVGVVGVVLLLLALTGPVLWWPGWQRLLHGFAVALRGGAYRGLRDLHRVGGIIAAVVLVVIAATGILVVWKVELQPVLARVVPTISKPAPKVAARDDRDLLPLDQVVAIARARYGGASVLNVRFPGGSGRVVTVFLDAPGSTRPRASNQVWLDGYTGSVLGSYEAATLPPGNGILDWMLPIHSGEALGAGGRLLFLVAALGLSGLAATGVVMWAVRRSATGRGERDRVLAVEVARVWDETPAVRALELRAVDGTLPPFTAGAHIDVGLPGGLVRQYSIWSDPADRTRYGIAVLRVPASRGGSEAVHALSAGEVLRISPPRNLFELVEDAPFSVLIAGGIGVTPLLAMASRLHALGRPFTFHYCSRSQSGAAFLPMIQRSGWAAHLRLHLSNQSPHQRFDCDEALRGAVAGTHVYVCGPARLIDDVLATARRRGFVEDKLHAELFQGAAPVPEARSFDVRLARSGIIAHVAPDQTVIAALAARGISIPVSCGQGICGTCLTRVVDGVPDHRDRCLTPDERARNDVFAPCCSRAVTPLLVLDI